MGGSNAFEYEPEDKLPPSVVEMDIVDMDMPPPRPKFPVAQPTDKAAVIASKIPIPQLREWASTGTYQERVIKLIMIVVAILILLAIIALIVLFILFTFFQDNGESPNSPNTPTPPSNKPSPLPSVAPSVCLDCGKPLWADWRLPPYTIPSDYVLHFSPDFATSAFSGSAAISVTLLGTVQTLVLHAKNLTISSGSVVAASGSSKTRSIEAFNATATISYNPTYQLVYFAFKPPLAPGNYTLNTSFKGNFTDDLAGLYRSTFTAPDGSQQYLAVTQFEPSDARKAFPCFDEPHLKSTFELHVHVPAAFASNMIALSNMPATSSPKRSVEADGDAVYVFQRSPLMSSYLVAFAVGNFVPLAQLTDPKGRPITVWGVPGNEGLGDFALDVANRTVQYFEAFYKIDYALPKLDLLAIPDFEAGAMENWGIVTFRQTALLLDPAQASSYDRQRVAVVVAHELAHQWTGNLVTTSWWDNLWLNEGFAEFFETEAVNFLFPEWRMRDQFIPGDQQYAMNIDQLGASHPLVHQAASPSDIQQNFDTITYSKGASVLRMIQGYIGPQKFQWTMMRYVSLFEFSNTVSRDFLQAASDVARLPLIPLFERFLNQSGYPLVTIQQVSNTTRWTLSQRAFFVDDTKVSQKKTNSTWNVPITIITPSKTVNTILPWNDTVTVDLGASKWFKVNGGQNGYYRTNYPDQYWNALKLNMHNVLPPADRAGLINDAFVLARAGALAVTQALDLGSALAFERQYAVWVSALTELIHISDLLLEEECFGSFKLYMIDILSNVVDFVGWVPDSNDSQSTTLLRSTILQQAVTYGVPGTVDHALGLWAKFNDEDDSTPIDPDLRPAVYYAASRYGTDLDYIALYRLYLATTNAAEGRRILYALGKAREFYLLEATLHLCINTTLVRAQDTVYCISGVAANPLGRNLAWNFVQENWSLLSGPPYALGSLITATTSHFDTLTDFNQVQSFFLANSYVGAEQAVKQSLENILANINWRARSADNVCGWLSSNYPLFNVGN
eukprot:TRINITY_DN492_c1_g1_i1.p1 TRINITY_DN492_c1_g1~~TRINITY_DN492_c1_g1_i1.p1  ORF type:complete len:1016 (+),score=563.28 TRINITY_DN492_c1_g1_i1:219-3266(+)